MLRVGAAFGAACKEDAWDIPFIWQTMKRAYENCCTASSQATATLGQRLKEVVIPIPNSEELKKSNF